MATLDVTLPINANAGAVLRRLAKQIEKAAAPIPDSLGSGASVVLTVDNSPAVGICTIQITAGPYQTGVLPV